MSIKKLLRNQKGFSLIELLIVIGIMAILAVIIIPRFADTGEDSRIAANSANISLLQSAVERYQFDKGKYPTSDGKANRVIDQSLLVNDKYINEIAENPWKDVAGHDNKAKKYKLDSKGNVLLQ